MAAPIRRCKCITISLLVFISTVVLPSNCQSIYRSYNTYDSSQYPSNGQTSNIHNNYNDNHNNNQGNNYPMNNNLMNKNHPRNSHQENSHVQNNNLQLGRHVGGGLGYHGSDNRRGHEQAAYPGSEISSSGEAWERGAAGPSFDPTPPRNITALKDANAYLHCIVNNLANKTLSWIREKDLHILTVGAVTYTADNRFEVIHKDNSNSWTLKINSVQPRDTGRYECQVNSHPTDPITFEVYLAVFVPTARIVGSTERFVDRGSTINLTCIINHNPDPPSATFWYHNNKVINYDSRGSRVSVITDRGTSTKTILLIHDASDSASGIYSCAPSPSAAASVKIHILNGETPAAMQTNGGSPAHILLANQLQFSKFLLAAVIISVFTVSMTSGISSIPNHHSVRIPIAKYTVRNCMIFADGPSTEVQKSVITPNSSKIVQQNKVNPAEMC